MSRQFFVSCSLVLLFIEKSERRQASFIGRKGYAGAIGNILNTRKVRQELSKKKREKKRLNISPLFYKDAFLGCDASGPYIRRNSNPLRRLFTGLISHSCHFQFFFRLNTNTKQQRQPASDKKSVS